MRHWEIARYDNAYKKTRSAWRTVHNHPVDVTHYMKLPDMPEK